MKFRARTTVTVAQGAPGDLAVLAACLPRADVDVDVAVPGTVSVRALPVEAPDVAAAADIARGTLASALGVAGWPAGEWTLEELVVEPEPSGGAGLLAGLGMPEGPEDED